jgi:hypothetical protein
MGYMAHHAVVVYSHGFIEEGRFGYTPPDIEGFRESLPPEFQSLVIGPVPTACNGDYVYVFLPDGFKEGWSDSDLGDQYRRTFCELFDPAADVVEVRFGGDDPDLLWIEDRHIRKEPTMTEHPSEEAVIIHGYGDTSDCLCGRNFPTVRGLREHLTKHRTQNGASDG